MYEKVIKKLRRAIPYRKTFKDKNIDFEAIGLYDYIYILCIYFKKLCEEGRYKYEDISKLTLEEAENKVHREHYLRFLNIKYKIRDVMKDLKSYDNSELVFSLLKAHNHELGISLYDFSERKDCYIYSYNISCYDPFGNTTYIAHDTFSRDVFEMLDIILGISNTYIQLLKTNPYKPVSNNIFICFNKIIVFKEESFLKKMINDIRLFLEDNKSVMLKTEYKYISKLDKEFAYLGIDKVIMDKNIDDSIISFKAYDNSIISFKAYDNSTINYNINRSRPISLILYDSNNIKTINQLKELIKKDEENPDNLIKVNLFDLEKYNYRIGFRLYSMKDKVEIVKELNELVDANNKLLNHLNEIDKLIKEEIDKLINK